MVRDIEILISSNRDSALVLTRIAYEQSTKLGYKQGIADAGWLLGSYEMHNSRHEEALKYYQRSMEVYREFNQQDKLAEVYILVGINDAMQNKSSTALSWFLKALEIAQKLNDDRKIADINYKIGIVYGQVNDWKNATLYSERSLTYAQRRNDVKMLEIVYNNLGVLYGQMKNYDKALEVLKAARSLVHDENTARALPDIYQNMGTALLEKGQFELAKTYLDSALVFHTNTQYPKGIATTSLVMAELLIKQKNYGEAYGYLERGMQLTGEADDKSSLYDANVLLHKIYTGQGKYRDAAMLFDTIMALQKIVENAEERTRVEQVSMAVEIQKAQDAVETIAAENDAKTWQRNLFILATFFTLVIVVIGSTAMIQIRKKNRQLTTQKADLTAANEMKDKVFAVISHDLRSPLNSLIGSLELLEANVLDEKEERILLNNLHLSASATLETLDNLLHWGSGQFKNEVAHQEAVDVNMLAEQTQRLLNNVAAHKSVNLVHKIEDVCIARFDKAQLAFIMRNLMVNAIKFSHEGQDVELHGRKENDRIILQVKDQGIGMSEETRKRLFHANDRVTERGTAGERGVGLGLVLINEFLNKNNGTITVSSKEGKGSCFEVIIPAV